MAVKGPPCVVIPIHTQHFVMLERNLLYTATTRGRKLVVIVGSKKAISMATKKTGMRRSTILKERLRDEPRASAGPLSKMATKPTGDSNP